MTQEKPLIWGFRGKIRNYAAELWSGRFDDKVLARIYDASLAAIAACVSAGARIATGSDAGAVGVLHGSGIDDEYACFAQALPDASVRERAIKRGNEYIARTFLPSS